MEVYPETVVRSSQFHWVHETVCDDAFTKWASQAFSSLHSLVV